MMIKLMLNTSIIINFVLTRAGKYSQTASRLSTNRCVSYYLFCTHVDLGYD